MGCTALSMNSICSWYFGQLWDLLSLRTAPVRCVDVGGQFFCFDCFVISNLFPRALPVLPWSADSCCVNLLLLILFCRPRHMQRRKAKASKRLSRRTSTPSISEALPCMSEGCESLTLATAEVSCFNTACRGRCSRQR